MNANSHGGKRTDSGRKKTGKAKSSVVRVSTELLLLINQYKLDGKAFKQSTFIQHDADQVDLRHLKDRIATLTDKIDYLEHSEHNCQYLTSKGKRCKIDGKFKRVINNIEINVCSTHAKKET